MRFEQLRIEGLRCLQHVDLAPGSGLNLVTGPNGAGKTSVLEAMYLLSRGRSFRGGSPDVMMARSATSMHAFGRIRSADGERRLGLERAERSWRIQCDGQRGERLTDLIGACAVVCFEPGMHALVSGPADGRRRFLDWGVFHVEHGFLQTWRRYQRALKQRNSLLRGDMRPRPDELDAWEAEMSTAGAGLQAQRTEYLQRLGRRMETLCSQFVPELGEVSLQDRPGWNLDDTLADTLRARRETDRQRGHTTRGPHRADWRPVFTEAPQREYLSRGQEKLCALACLLGQAEVFAADHGEWPVVCMDDLASELDHAHREAVVRQLFQAEAQVFITSTENVDVLAAYSPQVFHVEHGAIRPDPG